MHGGDIVAAVLAAQRTPFLFTLCGGHISPILVASKQRGIRIVDTRHEATAVFAADAVARLTGRFGHGVSRLLASSATAKFHPALRRQQKSTVSAMSSPSRRVRLTR